MEAVRDFVIGGSKITTDGDCSHDIKRRLLLGGKAMTNLDSTLKSRDITLPTKVCLVKAVVFPVVVYGCESWTIKKADCRRIDAFELWCWRRLLRVPWIARKSVLNIHWKYWWWSWNSNILPTWWQRTNSLEKTLMWERLKAGGEGADRGWDGWMASLTQWTWVWVSSGSWWWIERPGVLWSMGSQRVGHDWATKLTNCLWSISLSWKISSQFQDGEREVSVSQSCPAPDSSCQVPLSTWVWPKVCVAITASLAAPLGSMEWWRVDPGGLEEFSQTWGESTT